MGARNADSTVTIMFRGIKRGGTLLYEFLTFAEVNSKKGKSLQILVVTRRRTIIVAKTDERERLFTQSSWKMCNTL